MNGFLNYAAPGLHKQRGAVYGLASTGVAIAVLFVPVLFATFAALGEYFIAQPGLTTPPFSNPLILLVIPTLAMVLLPAIGLIFAAAGIALGKRACQFALTGVIVNTAALTAAVWSILIGH